jgi:hypothetical protein
MLRPTALRWKSTSVRPSFRIWTVAKTWNTRSCGNVNIYAYWHCLFNTRGLWSVTMSAWRVIITEDSGTNRRIALGNYYVNVFSCSITVVWASMEIGDQTRMGHQLYIQPIQPLTCRSSRSTAPKGHFKCKITGLRVKRCVNALTTFHRD